MEIQQQEQQTEEKFLEKNKTMIIGGLVAFIIITLIVGIGMSVKNTSKLEGMIMRVQSQTEDNKKETKSPQEESIMTRIPRK